MMQDIRMMKMKISGGFRTRAGAETFATLRSVPSTARKQGRNILQTLTTPAAVLIQDSSGRWQNTHQLPPWTA